MASITFFLKEPGAARPTPIIARLAHAGTKTKVYTGLSIEPGRWLQTDQRIQTHRYPAGARLNDALTLMRERLLACFLDGLAVGALPTPEELRAAIEPDPAAPTAPAPAARPELLTVFADWIERRALTHAVNTLRANRTTLRHLRDFAAAERRAVDFDTLGADFGERFGGYLLTVRGLTDAPIQKNLIILKTFLTWAAQKGHPAPVGLRLRWQAREPDILTLTRTEVGALAALDLPPDGYLDNARALFLIGCYTGLRFSDVAALRPQHVLPDRLRITTQKTRDTLTIPLRPEAAPLLARVTAGILRPLTNQKLNAYLKELAALAALDTPTERTRYAGGERRTTTTPKHALITTHTARRTFVTLALEAGMRPEVIMKITGHKDLKTFRRYVNVTEDTALTEFARTFGTPDGQPVS